MATIDLFLYGVAEIRGDMNEVKALFGCSWEKSRKDLITLNLAAR